jgi:hypothetical protein
MIPGQLQAKFPAQSNTNQVPINTTQVYPAYGGGRIGCGMELSAAFEERVRQMEDARNHRISLLQVSPPPPFPLFSSLLPNPKP